MRIAIMPRQKSSAWRSYLELMTAGILCAGAITANEMSFAWPAINTMALIVTTSACLVIAIENFSRAWPRALYSDLSVTEIERALHKYEEWKRQQKQKQKPPTANVRPKAPPTAQPMPARPTVTAIDQAALARTGVTLNPSAVPQPTPEDIQRQLQEQPYDLTEEYNQETERERLAREFGG